MPSFLFRAPLLAASLLGVATVALAAESAPKSPLQLSGDLRARYESDWNSHTANGTPRDDRDRARVRARLGFTWQAADAWSVGARLRTGNPNAQQSPHLTFWSSDDATDDFDAQFDRYYIQYKDGALTAWGGRNVTPFWQPNEIFWDEDVTPTGITGSYEKKLARGSLTSTLAAFYMPDGNVDLNGTLLGGQLRYNRPVEDGQLILAAGLYRFNGTDGAEHLINRNGVRDYLIGIVAAQWVVPLAPNRPLTFGAELLQNFEDYSAADAAPYPPAHADQTDGFVFSTVLGQLKGSGDWLVGYYFAYLETFAVNSSYSTDDWARFGSGPQAAVSDFQGHELRAAYAFTPALNLMVRYFVVDGIVSAQDAQRWRADLNFKF